MLQLLNNITHKDLRVIHRRGAQWGDNVMSAPVIADEFRSLQAHYPIVFQKDGQGNFQPVVLFGLEQGQNLFLNANGKEGWDADYVPLAMQRMPFSIGVAEDELRVMVDMASPRISTGADGEAVFLPQGGNTDLLEHASSVLNTLHTGLQAVPDFMQTLVANELLESFVLDVEKPDGSVGRLVGFYMIHEERLAALEANTVAMLHQADYLQPIYMAIASLSNFAPMIRRRLALEG